MGAIYDFLMAWKDLIIKVFGAFPLAASLVTILGAGAFYMLQKQWRRGHTTTNLMVTFVAWAITVPILGFLIDVLGVVWSLVEKVMGFVVWVSKSFYEIYTHHPYLVLGVVLTAVLIYIARRLWKPNVLPNRLVQGLLLIGAVVLVVHVAAPIADQFWPTAVASTGKRDAEGGSVQPSKTQPPATIPVPAGASQPTLTAPMSQPTK